MDEKTSGAVPGRPRVSLCMIVKNEEAHLADCLKSAGDLVDEIVVVDTGSTDRTKEIARERGARVFDFPWIDDFAAARNESIRHATHEWIFWMDADDRLDEENRNRLRTLFAGLTNENIGYLMLCVSLLDQRSESRVVNEHVRLFRNDPAIRWQYPVHEQIAKSIQDHGGRVQRTDVVIQHSGYLDAEQGRRKTQRNLAILERVRQERPNDPFVLFYLGWSHWALGRTEEAIGFLQASLQHEEGGPTAAKAYSLLVQGCRRLGQLEEARKVCREARVRFPDDLELLEQDALLRHARGDLSGAESALVKLLRIGGQSGLNLGADPGLWGYRTRYKLGVVYQMQGKLAEAEKEWEAALAERPEYVPAWVALADVWLSQDRMTELDTAASRLERDPRRVEAGALLRATWYQAQSRFIAARRLLETQLAAQPSSPWLRLALAAALMLEEKDLPGAERLLNEVLELDPDNEDAREGLAELRRMKYGGKKRR
jgi:tetratricopeptide (TPR) repeat protein